MSTDFPSIRPSATNPRYWDLGDGPVLLLGGTSDHDLFQHEPVDLEAELDRVAAAGGNVVRNTMSDRDPGDLRAFARQGDGTYDLSRWNPEYWHRFDTLLQLTAERKMVVQLELWDRFDHSREPWLTDPWNPANNMNYTVEQTGLLPAYPVHPSNDVQPFFHSVPGLVDNRTLLLHQERFAEQVLTHTLKYGHVLYCIDNETTSKEAWGAYWADFIHRRAEAAGHRVYVTQMWDIWDMRDPIHRHTIDRPDRYDFIDISQNSQVTGQLNWEQAQYVYRRTAAAPRPINSTKIYGSDAHTSARQGKGTAHAICTFWRNILGGFASSRFHRPDHGLGSSETALRQLRAARLFQKTYDLFSSVPDSDGMRLRAVPGQAHAAVVPGQAAAVFLPEGRPCELRCADMGKTLRVEWLDVSSARTDAPAWESATRVQPDKKGCIPLAPPRESGIWLAVVHV